MDMSDLDSNKGQQQEMQFYMTENAEYQKEQIQEIKLGREQGLDISLASASNYISHSHRKKYLTVRTALS